MKRILYFLLDQWADFEAAYLSTAVSMIGGGQFENKIVSLTDKPVKSIGGFSVLPDYDLKNVLEEYDALILIGGMSWHNEEAYQVKSFVEKTIKEGKLLGAICDACRFLGTIGVLNYGKHTANDLTELKESAGAAYINEVQFIHRQAVSDNNIVTANGTATMEFAKEVMLALQVAEEKVINAWYEFHKLGIYVAPLPEMR